MATVGQSLTSPDEGWTRYDDTNSNITYSGDSWVVGSPDASNYNSTYHYCGNGGIARFNFTGPKFRLIGTGYSALTTAASVYIDGVLAASFSQHSTSGVIYQQLNADISGLANKEHYVSIINNSASNMAIDAVDIDSAGILKPYNTNPTTTNQNQCMAGGV